jgi:hypothetical protein
MINIFYSYSNHRETSLRTFNTVFELVNNNEENNNEIQIIDVSNNDIINSNNLLIKIKNHINDADIFVCDITPDSINENNVPLISSNVMIELGYALNKFEKNNMIILLNDEFSENFNDNIPSLLAGYDIKFYNSDSSDESYCIDIIEEINNVIKNIEKELGNPHEWFEFNYNLSEKFKSTIKIILDIKLKSYKILINKNKKYSYIFLYSSKGKPRKINIATKILHLKNNNKKDLSLFNQDVYTELQHLEIIINNKFNL